MAATKYAPLTVGSNQSLALVLPPNITQINGATELCSGEQTNITPVADLANTHFEWTVSQTGSQISGLSDGSGNNITQTLYNNDTQPETATYIITPITTASNGIQSRGPSADFRVIVKPKTPNSTTISMSYQDINKISINTISIDDTYTTAGFK